DLRGRPERHGGDHSLFTEFGMTEDDFMRTDSQRDAADWCFTDAIAIDPRFGPGKRVERYGSLRHVELQRRHLTGLHVDDASRFEAKRLVDDLEVMTTNRNHDAIGLAAAKQTVVLVELHIDDGIHRNPA